MVRPVKSLLFSETVKTAAHNKTARTNVRSALSDAARALASRVGRTAVESRDTLVQPADPWLVRPREARPVWVATAMPYVENPLVDADIPQAQRRGLFDLDATTCSWPLGDPARGDFFFCGAQPVVGRPYCARHLTRAFVPRKSTDKRALSHRHRRARGQSHAGATKGERK